MTGKGAPNIFLSDDFLNLEWFFRSTGKTRTPIFCYANSRVNEEETLQAAARDRAEHIVHAAKFST